jgi:protein subunit release factor B
MVRRHATDRASLERDTQVTFFRGGGPGGQHRNKSETGVRLFHAASGITVVASERRSRAQNRETAFRRLADRLRYRNRRVKPRIPTRKSRASEERRLAAKRSRARTKTERRPPRED